MKGIKFAGALALALICGTWTMASPDVFAIENATVITESQFTEAIENAENALFATAGMANIEGQAAYLRDLVNQAKVLRYDVEGNQDKNLGELVDALNEGARGLILISGANRQSRTAAEPAMQNMQSDTATESASVRTVAAEVATTMADLGVSVTVSKDEPVVEKKTEVAEASDVEKTETEKDDAIEGVENSENPLGENDEIEVPKTGENAPSPIAVGITVGVIVFVALAGALAIVKRLKRDA